MLDHPLEFWEKSKHSPRAKNLPRHVGPENNSLLFELRAVHFSKFKCQATLLNREESFPAESVICFRQRKALPVYRPPWEIGSLTWGTTHFDELAGLIEAEDVMHASTRKGTLGLSTLLIDQDLPFDLNSWTPL